MPTWPVDVGVVEFPDGRRVRGRALRRVAAPTMLPDLTVHLAPRPPAPLPWAQEWVQWRDFRTPTDPDHAVAVLRSAFDRAREERVEIACRGGVGRTGTALAVLALLAGVPRGEVVAWVRRRYHPRAVETPWQRRWLERRVPLDP